jgi:biotin carboxyl carrier protein
MNTLRSLLGWIMPLLILGGGVAAFMAMGSQPPPPRRAADAAAAAMVRTMPVVREAGVIEIDFDGVVVPLREVTLSAEVGGRVVQKSAACRGGQFVTEGTLLLQVDPRDYELEVRRLEQERKQAVLSIEEIDEEIKQNARSVALAKRQVELAHREVERLDGLKSSRVVTEADYERALRDELSADSTLNSLQGQTRVLAKRRIRLTEAQTLTATMLERAELDLARTKLVAPFSGMVVSDMVEQDSFVSKGTPLVSIEDTSAAEVRVSLQMDEVARIWSDSRRQPTSSVYDFPATPATVIYQIGERQYRWRGVFKRQEGKGIDERTRTLPCRVLVADPAAVEALDRYGAALPELPAGAPLSLLRGMFVDVRVQVETDQPLVSTPCEALRPNGDVWAVRNDAVTILRPPLVQVAAGRAVFESTSDGLQPTDRVVVSQLSNVRAGMAVAETAADRPAVKTAQAPESTAPVTPPPSPTIE